LFGVLSTPEVEVAVDHRGIVMGWTSQWWR
jgi:hypothetical protein